MNFKTLLVGTLFAISASSVAQADDDLATIVKAAKDANKKAAKLGFEWRDTGKMLKKIADEKDSDKAIKLAKKALKQAEDAQKQAETAKDAGPRL